MQAHPHSHTHNHTHPPAVTVSVWLQLVQRPPSSEPDSAAQLGGTDSPVMLPAEAAAAAAAADPLAEAHGLADPRDSDTAAAMEGVEGDESLGEDGASAAAATAGQKVCKHVHTIRLLIVTEMTKPQGSPLG